MQFQDGYNERDGARPLTRHRSLGGRSEVFRSLVRGRGHSSAMKGMLVVAVCFHGCCHRSRTIVRGKGAATNATVPGVMNRGSKGARLCRVCTLSREAPSVKYGAVRCAHRRALARAVVQATEGRGRRGGERGVRSAAAVCAGRLTHFPSQHPGKSRHASSGTQRPRLATSAMAAPRGGVAAAW